MCTVERKHTQYTVLTQIKTGSRKASWSGKSHLSCPVMEQFLGLKEQWSSCEFPVFWYMLDLKYVTSQGCQKSKIIIKYLPFFLT